MSMFNIPDGAPYEEIYNELSERMAQAEALARVLQENYDGIKESGDRILGHYLWALDRIMNEAHALFCKFPDELPSDKTDEAA